MRNQKGFTLIELLVVIGIIGLLATVAVVSLTAPRRTARDTKRIADVTNIRTALELYSNENGGYPDVGSSPVGIGTAAFKTLSSGSGFAATGTGNIYMDNIPPRPTPPAGDYMYQGLSCTSGKCDNYIITFLLEGAVQNINCSSTANTCKATPGGIGPNTP